MIKPSETLRPECTPRPTETLKGINTGLIVLVSSRQRETRRSIGTTSVSIRVGPPPTKPTHPYLNKTTVTVLSWSHVGSKIPINYPGYNSTQDHYVIIFISGTGISQRTPYGYWSVRSYYVILSTRSLSFHHKMSWNPTHSPFRTHFSLIFSLIFILGYRISSLFFSSLSVFPLTSHRPFGPPLFYIFVPSSLLVSRFTEYPLMFDSSRRIYTGSLVTSMDSRESDSVTPLWV